MRRAKLVLLSSICLIGAALPAEANVLIKVDQSTQRMSVDVDGQHLYDWSVSTGRPGYETPNGTYRPNRMDSNHFSDEYDSAPMPHAIFFDLKGHAIHGTFEPIGHPAASHGCVRLDLVNAAKLFDLVDEQGLAHTTVEITGDVMVALRNLKSAPRMRAARKQPPPSPQPAASSDQDVQQLGSYNGQLGVNNANGYAQQRQDYPTYGDYAPRQPGWPW